MTTQKTSAMAYREPAVQSAAKHYQKKILEAIKVLGPSTQSEIFEHIRAQPGMQHIGKSSVNPRFSTLRKMGAVYIKSESRKCSITGRTVQQLDLVKNLHGASIPEVVKLPSRIKQLKHAVQCLKKALLPMLREHTANQGSQQHTIMTISLQECEEAAKLVAESGAEDL